jgi:hypothetical protein
VNNKVFSYIQNSDVGFNSRILHLPLALVKPLDVDTLVNSTESADETDDESHEVHDCHVEDTPSN